MKKTWRKLKGTLIRDEAGNSSISFKHPEHNVISSFLVSFLTSTGDYKISEYAKDGTEFEVWFNVPKNSKRISPLFGKKLEEARNEEK